MILEIPLICTFGECIDQMSFRRNEGIELIGKHYPLK